MPLCQYCCRGLIAIMIVLLAACSSYTKPGGEPAPAEPPPVASPPVYKPVPPPQREQQAPPRPATHSASAAWQPLLAKAEQAAGRGDYEQALALLERAQRIDPDSAEVYLGIAQTHWAKGDKAQARATAERGLLYCSSQRVCDALRAYSR